MVKLVTGLVLGLILGSAIVIGGYFFFSTSERGDESITLTFTEEELQKKIGEKFPLKDRILDYIPVTIEQPQVKLLGDSKRLQLSVKASVAIPFVPSEVIEGVFTSSVRYKKKDQSLRISDLTVENISTSRLPKRYESALRLALTATARKYLDDYIVHIIEPKDIPRAMAGMFIQKIKVKNGRLEIILGL